MGAVLNSFIAEAFPILKFNKLNPGKALSEVQAELSDAFAGILLDVGSNLVFDTEAFIPNAEASTLEEHNQW